VKKIEVNDPPISNELSIILEINSIDDDGPPRMHLETTGPPQEEDEGGVGLLQELRVLRAEGLQRRRLLHMKLAVFFRKKGGAAAQLDRAAAGSEQQQYEKLLHTLTGLKLQLAADSGSAEQQAEAQRSKARETLDTVRLISGNFA